jgi:hypothetical protein
MSNTRTIHQVNKVLETESETEWYRDSEVTKMLDQVELIVREKDKKIVEKGTSAFAYEEITKKLKQKLNEKELEIESLKKNVEYYENKNPNKRSDPERTKEKMKIIFGKRDDELENIIKIESKRKLAELQSRYNI